MTRHSAKVGIYPPYSRAQNPSKHGHSHVHSGQSRVLRNKTRLPWADAEDPAPVLAPDRWLNVRDEIWRCQERPPINSGALPRLLSAKGALTQEKCCPGH